jgi:hypothetical protein
LLATSLFSPVLVPPLLSNPARVLQLLTAPVLVPAAPDDPVTRPPSNSAVPDDSGTRQTRAPGTCTADRPWRFSSPALNPHRYDFYADSPNERHHESKRPRDPAETDEMMDSEKCVERIACRMALIQRISTIPFWTRW